MKHKILNIMIALMCLPIIALCSCSKETELPKIDASVYFESKVVVSTYNNTKTKNIDFADLILTEADPLNIDNYTEIKVTANSAWIYKMYIDKICFYVYTNQSADVEMIVNVKMTNLVNESEIGSKDAITTIEETCSFIPQENGSILCTVDVQKTVATATGCELSFDILNSTTGTVADEEGKATDFRWMIYGLEFYAEHRAY